MHRSSHNKLNKISLVFLWFFYIFLRFFGDLYFEKKKLKINRKLRPSKLEAGPGWRQAHMEWSLISVKFEDYFELKIWESRLDGGLYFNKVRGLFRKIAENGPIHGLDGGLYFNKVRRLFCKMTENGPIWAVRLADRTAENCGRRGHAPLASFVAWILLRRLSRPVVSSPHFRGARGSGHFVQQKSEASLGGCVFG